MLHGMVLDLGKKKMSKSLGNIVSPNDIVQKFSRDHLRYYFAKVSRGEDFAFDEKEFLSIENVFRVLLNINNFVQQLRPHRVCLPLHFLGDKINFFTDGYFAA